MATGEIKVGHRRLLCRREKPWVVREPQETWAVAQPPEPKVGGAANPLPWAAKLLKLQVGSLA